MATEAQGQRPYPYEDLNRDLGFGAVVAGQRQRLLNRDGSFNVMREGLRPWVSLSLYHDLLEITWPRFLGLIVVYYMAMNLLFALAYLGCGLEGIEGAHATTLGGRFLESFFFSVQTFATIGYGGMHPVGLAANLLVTLESLVGLLGFALATGLLFARFSRPVAKVLFSEKAITTPVVRIGWPDQFIEHATTQEELRRKYGLSVENTVARVKAQFSDVSAGSKLIEFA